MEHEELEIGEVEAEGQAHQGESGDQRPMVAGADHVHVEVSVQGQGQNHDETQKAHPGHRDDAQHLIEPLIAYDLAAIQTGQALGGTTATFFHYLVQVGEVGGVNRANDGQDDDQDEGGVLGYLLEHGTYPMVGYGLIIVQLSFALGT